MFIYNSLNIVQLNKCYLLRVPFMIWFLKIKLCNVAVLVLSLSSRTYFLLFIALET